ncbi:lipopolysaccharide biosynthesis protein [Butyrivibrio sp. MC2021]|uniref:lipopolysaccharide biosynthesis protein n=1 Tax=Butyrivibrio sp. MC2021 TaxID=1408306 RepID=UPI00047EBF03|nr:oligosaccharide flippase family protein [Butyrivibrio sp. MC2021]
MSSKSNAKELAKNTAIISIGKICTQLVSFLLLPVYTGILSTEEYGAVDLIITYTSLLLPIVTLQLEQAIFRFVIEKRENKKAISDVISSIYIISFATMFIFSIIFLGVSPLIHSQYKFYLFANLVANSFSSLMLQTARGLGKNGIYAFGSFLGTTLMVALNILFVVVFHMGADGMMYAHIIGATICGVYVFFALHIYEYIILRLPEIENIKRFLGYSLPLIPNQISWWILSASDRSVILWKMGVAYNGVYSIAGKFSNMYGIMYNIFNLSWTELISVHFHDDDREKAFSELQDMVVRLLMCIYLGIVSIMPFVFPVMINAKYEDAYYQIPILMLGIFFSAMIGVMSAYYIADKNTKVIAKTSMACAIINLVLDITLMPFIGLFAASIASAIAYFVMYIVRYIDINKRYGVKNSPKLLSILGGATVLVFVVYYYRNMVLCGICFLLVCAMSLIMNKKVIFGALQIVKNKIMRN